jgi:hypothetical protein
MKLVANIQLTPTKDEAKLLRQALEGATLPAMRHLSWGLRNSDPRKKVRQFNLQKVVYQGGEGESSRLSALR